MSPTTDIHADEARIDFHGPCCCWHAGDYHLITGSCTQCPCRQFTEHDPMGVLADPDFSDIHAPVPGNSPLCEYYLLMQRSIIEVQGKLIADLQRRLDGEPVTTVFLDVQ